MRLSDSEKQRIEACVKAAEARTGAEFATAVVGKSDHYPEIPWKAFALGVSLVALTRVMLWLFAQPRWGGGPGLLADVMAMLGGGALLALIAVRSRSVGHLFVGRHRAESEVTQHALVMMLRREMFATAQRNAVLILVSVFERQVVILPDRGVAPSIPRSELHGVIAAMAPLLRDGRVCDALCLGVTEMAGVLPQRTGGSERQPGLPDAVIEEDGDDGGGDRDGDGDGKT